MTDFNPLHDDPQQYDAAFGDYDGTNCQFCDRLRVMIGGATGKRICEKCGQYQEISDKRGSNERQ
jgi:hypothetical protein